MLLNYLTALATSGDYCSIHTQDGISHYNCMILEVDANYVRYRTYIKVPEIETNYLVEIILKLNQIHAISLIAAQTDFASNV